MIRWYIYCILRWAFNRNIREFYSRNLIQNTDLMITVYAVQISHSAMQIKLLVSSRIDSSNYLESKVDKTSFEDL